MTQSLVNHFKTYVYMFLLYMTVSLCSTSDIIMFYYNITEVGGIADG